MLWDGSTRPPAGSAGPWSSAPIFPRPSTTSATSCSPSAATRKGCRPSSGPSSHGPTITKRMPTSATCSERPSFPISPRPRCSRPSASSPTSPPPIPISATPTSTRARSISRSPATRKASSWARMNGILCPTTSSRSTTAPASRMPRSWLSTRGSAGRSSANSPRPLRSRTSATPRGGCGSATCRPTSGCIPSPGSCCRCSSTTTATASRSSPTPRAI